MKFCATLESFFSHPINIQKTKLPTKLKHEVSDELKIAIFLLLRLNCGWKKIWFPSARLCSNFPREMTFLKVRACVCVLVRVWMWVCEGWCSYVWVHVSTWVWVCVCVGSERRQASVNEIEWVVPKEKISKSTQELWVTSSLVESPFCCWHWKMGCVVFFAFHCRKCEPKTILVNFKNYVGVIVSKLNFLG